MANDRETKSFEVKRDERPDYSAAARNQDQRGGRLTQGEAGGTMSGNRDADLRPHGEAGSSGVGLPPMPDNDMRISTRDGARESGGTRALGASTGTGPDQDTGVEDDR